MLDHEYRQKLRDSEKRDWVTTIATAVLAIVLVGLIVAMWKYIGHDPMIIISMMIPVAFLAIILILAAFNGRRSVIKRAWEVIAEAAWFWPFP
jgi:NhaP-type Na+/H+ or K+/H+ antiporter